MIVALTGPPRSTTSGTAQIARALAAELAGIHLDKRVLRDHLFPPAHGAAADEQKAYVFEVMLKTTVWHLDRRPQLTVLLDGRTFTADTDDAALPGGHVSGTEAAPDALRRSLRDQLGVTATVGTLLAIDTYTPCAEQPVTLVHLYAVDRIRAEDFAAITFRDQQICEAEFLRPDQALRRLPERSRRLVLGALHAQVTGGVAFLEDGIRLVHCESAGLSDAALHPAAITPAARRTG